MISEQRLREIPLLRSLPSEELKNLGLLLKERKASKGNFILYADDPGPSIMFIGQGEVKITLLGNDGKEIVLAHLQKGDFFGEIAVLTGEERSANVVAMDDCELLVLSQEDFERHVLTNSGLALSMLKELAFRLRGAAAKIGDLALFDVYRRVARTLKSLSKEEMLEGEVVHVISRRPTHQELASIVGTSREMVTRALKGLEEDGCIFIDGKQIVIRKLPL